jgi:hypothetical protein
MKRKSIWKNVLCAVLVIAAVVGLGAGVSALAKRDTKTIGATAFTRGGLNEKGEYVETNQTLYTEKAFNCIGLRVEPDFEFKGTYDVYYYDYDGTFLESRLGLSKVYAEDYPLAMTARIVIHPEIPEDVKKSDYKIAFYEIASIASKLKITVDKVQEREYSANLYDESSALEGKTFHQDGVSVFEWLILDDQLIPYEFCKTSNKIFINGKYNKFDMYFRFEEEKLPPDAYLTAVLSDENGKVVAVDGVACEVNLDAGNVNDHEWYKITIEVPEDSNASFLRISMPADTENCYVFGYND